MQASQHASLDTALGADSVALVGPATTSAGATTQLAVVGTYTLKEAGAATPRAREGALLLVSASRRGDACTLSLEHAARDIPAVLDVTTAGAESTTTLYAACADNTLLAFDADASSATLRARGDVRGAARGDESSRIVLAVDAVREEPGSDACLIAASDSAGSVMLHRIGRESELLRRWDDAHAEEAWSVCVDGGRAGDAPTVYSGGDDGALCAWGVGEESCRFRLHKPHAGVGVTAVAKERGDWEGDAGYQLWTGGYDDVLRLWDVRAMRCCLSEVGVGGGVWRVRFHPRKRGLLLVAAMYDGFKVVRREEGSDRLSVACQYRGHEGLAYGATWVPSLDSGDEYVALTASFYDHSLQLWTIEDPT